MLVFHDKANIYQQRGAPGLEVRLSWGLEQVGGTSVTTDRNGGVTAQARTIKETSQKTLKCCYTGSDVTSVRSALGSRARSGLRQQALRTDWYLQGGETRVNPSVDTLS